MRQDVCQNGSMRYDDLVSEATLLTGLGAVDEAIADGALPFRCVPGVLEPCLGHLLGRKICELLKHGQEADQGLFLGVWYLLHHVIVKLLEDVLTLDVLTLQVSASTN